VRGGTVFNIAIRGLEYIALLGDELNESMEHGRNNTDREQPKCLKKNLVYCPTLLTAGHME